MPLKEWQAKLTRLSISMQMRSNNNSKEFSMSATMTVFLSADAADQQWGKNALLSFAAQGATIHVTDDHVLTTIQRAGRKLDAQGIKNVTLSGESWDLESIWAFIQGYRTAKNSGQVAWSDLDAEEEAELMARLKATNWTREMINLSPDEVTPIVLATRAAELIQSLAPQHVTYQIIEGDDLLQQGWNGTHAVGRGSHNAPVMLQLDYNPTGKEDAHVHTCLVGKGITFDSGGYSLKPSAGMSSMKADMGGAAMVTGGLALAIQRGCQKRIKLIL